MSVTAKVKCSGKNLMSMGTEYEQVQLTFSADYANGQNKEWSVATPALQLQMTVRPDVAERFTIGQAFTLTFEPEA